MPQCKGLWSIMAESTEHELAGQIASEVRKREDCSGALQVLPLQPENTAPRTVAPTFRSFLLSEPFLQTFLWRYPGVSVITGSKFYPAANQD